MCVSVRCVMVVLVEFDRDRRRFFQDLEHAKRVLLMTPNPGSRNITPSRNSELPGSLQRGEIYNSREPDSKVDYFLRGKRMGIWIDRGSQRNSTITIFTPDIIISPEALKLVKIRSPASSPTFSADKDEGLQVGMRSSCPNQVMSIGSRAMVANDNSCPAPGGCTARITPLIYPWLWISCPSPLNSGLRTCQLTHARNPKRGLSTWIFCENE